MPPRYGSPNASRTRDVLGTLMLGILAGSKRNAHIAGVATTRPPLRRSDSRDWSAKTRYVSRVDHWRFADVDLRRQECLRPGAFGLLQLLRGHSQIRGLKPVINAR